MTKKVFNCLSFDNVTANLIQCETEDSYDQCYQAYWNNNLDRRVKVNETIGVKLELDDVFHFVLLEGI